MEKTLTIRVEDTAFKKLKEYRSLPTKVAALMGVDAASVVRWINTKYTKRIATYEFVEAVKQVTDGKLDISKYIKK